MSGMSDKKTAKPTSVGSSTATTHSDASASGKVLPVVHPVDIVYLCIKMQAAKNSPYICINNTPRYQRQVTMWIRQDAASFRYKFPYCGEVGFKMTTTPPDPIMSKNEPFRPSQWPLSKYQLIYREYRKLQKSQGDPIGSYRFDFRSFNVVDSLVDKTTLENELSIKRSRDNDIEGAYRTINPEVANERFPNGRGVIRIPDVIKKKDYTLTGQKGYHPDNIDTVIEIKFPGDKLSPYQKKDYLKIAGNDRNKFRLMTLKQCKLRNRKDKEEEEILADAKADPLYQIVGETAMANTKLSLSIEQYMRLEYNDIYQHILRWVKQQEIEYSRPQLVAIVDVNQKMYEEAWRRYQERAEMVMAGPLAAVGVASAGAVGGALAVGTSAAEIATTATVVRNGTTVVEFIPLTKAAIATVGAASLPIAAKQITTNNYVFERNGQLTYYPEFNEQEKLKYQDDRLIEIDYRYQQNSRFDKKGINIINIVDDSDVTKENRDRIRIDEYHREIHYYPYRQQFYYYFTPGEEPTDFEEKRKVPRSKT